MHLETSLTAVQRFGGVIFIKGELLRFFFRKEWVVKWVFLKNFLDGDLLLKYCFF